MMPPMNCSDELNWFCVRSQPRNERLAAVNLLKLDNVEVFYPKETKIKKTKKGKRQLTSPLFPNYLFARFVPHDNMRAVTYSHGVSSIVRNGPEIVPVLPQIISELILITEEGLINVPEKKHRVGEHVKIITGLFAGAEGVVNKLIPASQRVEVLFELLGRELSVPINEDDLETDLDHPLAVF